MTYITYINIVYGQGDEHTHVTYLVVDESLRNISPGSSWSSDKQIAKQDHHQCYTSHTNREKQKEEVAEKGMNGETIQLLKH